jgi:hypothetical protein
MIYGNFYDDCKELMGDRYYCEDMMAQDPALVENYMDLYDGCVAHSDPMSCAINTIGKLLKNVSTENS